MNKHTPGPWKQSLPDECWIIAADGTDIAETIGDYDDENVWPVMEANARLIAAAPDLLEALKRIMPYANTGASVQDVYTSEQPEFIAARAAIAKAEASE